MEVDVNGEGTPSPDVDGASLMAEFNKESNGEQATDSTGQQNSNDQLNQGAANGQVAENQPGQQVAGQEADPELPANHWAREKGITTYGQLDQMYRNGSAEVRRYQETINGYAQLIQNYQQIMAQQRAPQQQQAQQGPQFDMKQFQALAAVDPVKAIQMAAEYGLQSNPQLVQRLVEPHLAPVQQQLAQAAQVEFERRLGSQYNDLVKQYPEAKEGTPEHAATYKWITENPWIYQVAKADPSFNAPKYAFMAATYDIQRQKMAGANNRLTEKRGKAATVRPGTGKATVNAGTDGAARAAAADLASRGINIPEDVIQGMERALRAEAL